MHSGSCSFAFNKWPLATGILEPGVYNSIVFITATQGQGLWAEWTILVPGFEALIFSLLAHMTAGLLCGIIETKSKVRGQW